MSSATAHPEARPVHWVQGASRGLGLALTTALLEGDPNRVVIASSRTAPRAAALRALVHRFPGRLHCVALDLLDFASLRGVVAEAMAQQIGPLHAVYNVAGALQDEALGLSPEKRLESLSVEALQRSMDLHVVGPSLFVQALFPWLKHSELKKIVNVSARVGSIEDNRQGGWYAYRISKAAQNQWTRTLAIELQRRTSPVICMAYHPGTVATQLSAPFLSRSTPYRVLAAEEAAEAMLRVIEARTEEDNGTFWAWDGGRVPW